MNKIALGIEYLGTNYCGWQRQKHCDSVQAQVEQALSQIAAEPIGLFCAGRTDTAVHGIGQVVHFETTAERPMQAWVRGTNTQLPGDVRVAWAKAQDNDFHARFSAVARQYRYVIYNREVNSAVLYNRVTWEPHLLDVEKMHLAAQSLVGENDYSSFRASACQANNAVREVQSLNVSRSGDMIFIDIKANAFLHHMVRNIAGTLIQIGRAQKPVEWVAEVLAMQNRRLAAPTAPASGLYFVNAFYPAEYEIPLVELDEVLWQS